MSKLNSGITIGSCIDVAVDNNTISRLPNRDIVKINTSLDQFVEIVGEFLNYETSNIAESLYSNEDWNDFEDILPQLYDEVNSILEDPIHDFCDSINFDFKGLNHNIFYDGVFICEIENGYIRTLIKDRDYALKHKDRIHKTSKFMHEQGVDNYYIIYIKLIVTVKNIPFRVILPGELK